MGRNTPSTPSASQPTLQSQEQRILSAFCQALPKDNKEKKVIQDRLLQWTGLIHRSGLLQSVIFAKRKQTDTKGWKDALSTVHTVLEALGEPELSKCNLHDQGLIDYQRLQVLILEVTALGARYIQAQLALHEELA